MENKRLYEILKNKEIKDIFYEEDPVWIQAVNQDIVKVGFLNGQEKNVYIEDLYEK